MRAVLVVAAAVALVAAACTSGASSEEVEELRAEVSVLREQVALLSEQPSVAAPTTASSPAPTTAPTALPEQPASPEPTAGSEEIDCALTIDEITISPRSERYDDFADLTLFLRNHGDVRVKAWRLGILFKDVFGNELFAQTLFAGSANILAGGIEDATFAFEDNQFIRDEPYDILLGFDPENLDLQIVICEVSFAES